MNNQNNSEYRYFSRSFTQKQVGDEGKGDGGPY